MASTITFAVTPIHRIRPDKRNARKHSKQQVDQIAASIAEHGFVNPILINPAGVMVGGHGRLRAARKLGLTEVPTITISGLSEAQERLLRISLSSHRPTVRLARSATSGSAAITASVAETC